MAQHTNWDKWMSENLRYALENNKNGKKLIYTYSEYYINHYKNNGYIDIVGKERYDSELNEDVIIEIKGSLSDLNSGHGQHFIGYFNFFATNREFLDKMIIYYRNNYINSGVGILVVENDGRVNTIIPAKHNNFNYFVESNFDKFFTDDEVEKFFTDIEIPKQEYMDKHKPYYRNRKETLCQKVKEQNVWNIF